MAPGRPRPGGLGLGASRRGSSGCATEARAVRERAGIIDLSSFGKIAVDGPGRPRPPPAGRRERRRPAGRQRHLHAVPRRARRDRRGRDRHAPGDDRFRVVTGAGFVASDLAWLEAARRRRRRRGPIRDVSGEFATIGLWGPRARDDPAAAAPGRRRRRGAPAAPGTDRSGSVERPVLAARISYAGELGWELTTPSRLGGRRLGCASARGSRRRARAVRLPGPRCRSGWRRATATSAPT